MPSGAAAHQGDEGMDAAAVGAGGGAEGTDMGGVAAVGAGRGGNGQDLRGCAARC
jgi:hypothetical protein